MKQKNVCMLNNQHSIDKSEVPLPKYQNVAKCCPRQCLVLCAQIWLLAAYEFCLGSCCCIAIYVHEKPITRVKTTPQYYQYSNYLSLLQNTMLIGRLCSSIYLHHMLVY